MRLLRRILVRSSREIGRVERIEGQRKVNTEAKKYESIMKMLENHWVKYESKKYDGVNNALNVGVVVQSGKELSDREKILLGIIYKMDFINVKTVFTIDECTGRVYKSGKKYTDLEYKSNINKNAIIESGVNNWIVSVNKETLNRINKYLNFLSLTIDLNGINAIHNIWSYGLSEFNPKVSPFSYNNTCLVTCPSAIAAAVYIALYPMMGRIDKDKSVDVFVNLSKSIMITEQFLGRNFSPNNGHEFEHCQFHLSENDILYKECEFRLKHKINLICHQSDRPKGIYVSLSAYLKTQTTTNAICNMYKYSYENQPFFKILDNCGTKPSTPLLSKVLNTPNVHIGGITQRFDGTKFNVSLVLDDIIRGGPFNAITTITLFNNITLYDKTITALASLENLNSCLKHFDD